MSDSFANAAAGLYHWMMSNHIDPKEMRVVLSMDGPEGSARVEHAILRELQHMQWFGAEQPLSKPMQAIEMHGVSFRLATRNQ